MNGSVLVNQLNNNITQYSVQEDATSLDPSDTTGGVGQIDFTVNPVDGPEGSIQLQGLDVELRDKFRGNTFGNIVEAGTNDDGLIDVSADSILGPLVGTASAKPMVDTFDAVIKYYLSLAEITENVFIDDSVAFHPVAVPGFSDEIWLRMKQLISVMRCEICVIGDNIVVRPVRTITPDASKTTNINWTVSKADPAQKVEVVYYGNEKVDGLVYPFTTDERDSMQSWQVDESAILEDDITLSVSVASIDQPVAVDSVEETYGETQADDNNSDDDNTTSQPSQELTSVYTVYDSKNQLVTAQNWRALGGKIELTINDDTKSLHIKITGAKGAGTAPYRIVGRKGTGDNAEDYPSLYITGTGVSVNPQTLTLPTGIAAKTTVTQIGTTVEVPAISTIEEAYDVGVRVAGGWTGSKMNLSGTVTMLNQRNTSGEVLYRPIADFNTEYSGKKIADFNTQWNSKTFHDFNANELSQVKTKFENQTFGNVAGSRFKYGDALYRIDSATITDENISFNASADTTIDDFNYVFTGKKIADFNTYFQGKTFRQYNRTPLTLEPSSGTIYVPPVPTDPYPDTFYPDQLYPGFGSSDTTGVAKVDSAHVDVNTVG